MTNPREHDEFTRIELISMIEKDRAIVAQYEEGLSYRREQIENQLYDLGKLDERLGGDSR